ncbi:MAG: OmpA family protein [Bacteroidota bacterium]
MKRIIIISSVFVFLVIAGFSAYFLITDYILVRSPMLVQVNPKITFITGDAMFRENTEQEWQMAIVGQSLDDGYQVKTEPDARMDIRFHENTAIRLNESTQMTIDYLSIRKMVLNVENGKMYGKFDKLFKNHELTVKTPTAIAAIRGTELGFDVMEELPRQEKNKSKKDKTDQEAVSIPEIKTMVYSLSGITEVSNPYFKDKKVLLSFRNKLLVDENEYPSNPEELNEDEILDLRALLNSIHYDEVLLITDKITFSVGSAEILPSSYPELDKITEILKKKNVDVRIEGHTDSQGDAAFNQALSEKRAASIKQYFVKKGLEAERFETTGFGETKPIASNKTKEGMAENRRVEFLIIE